MAGNLIYQSDLTGLDNYMQVLRALPESTRSFKVGLDLVPVREYATYRIPEIAELLTKANQHASLWSKILPAITALHRELEAFLEKPIQFIEKIRNSQDVTQQFIEQSRKRLSMFLDELDDHIKTLQSLTEGVYAFLPRIIDFMNSNIYRHANEYNLIVKNKEQSIALQKLTASIPFNQRGPALSAEARLNGAQNYVRLVHRQYAEAYCAAVNMDTYMARMCDLLGIAFAHTLRMSKTDVPSRPYVEANLMLVTLKEIRRFTQWFNSLTGNPT
ncbi:MULTISPECIES: hypothetical protein [Pseudomonas]|uniref:Uncharacterized protein n=1 Tax=Pseudomonas cichorii TaxID=36746 RepID=A0ABQ1DV54_PSECI|nr:MULTISPECIES: hypothetical protein [Pseudomonas]AHF65842.1 hypothetical protein PCH70_06890 [Pseudomonas cichorii JBC1]QVE17829.1 hypothetical protein KGD89_03385 [Pseudomonas cichorii]SDP20911.1 hypothetical protein SAMN05216599_12242 [Pseudomonas cichorii]GFM79056.1 hypothetical protein PSCICM_48750 [Pseudomonas cichorii]GFM94862.1 hypothetical protein PSCICP_48340 [Pseudomonas cichorii]